MTSLPKDVQALYPFESRFLDVDGHAMHYLDEGAGEPVLMVHGNPTWSFYYRGLVLGLRGRYRTIVPDHIGCGLSARPDDKGYRFTLERRVADLERLVGSLGIRGGLTLVLHDWGGMIGMGFAARHPEMIKRIVVTNTAAFHMPEGKRVPLGLRVARNTKVGALLVQGMNAFSRGAVMTAAKRPLPCAVKAGYLAPYTTWDERRAVLRFVQDIPLAPGDPAYAVVSEVERALPHFSKVPMLLCWGGKDFVFDDDYFAEWRRRFPHAEAHHFPKAGHYVLEDAGPEIMPLVQDFLARHPLEGR